MQRTGKMQNLKSRHISYWTVGEASAWVSIRGASQMWKKYVIQIADVNINGMFLEYANVDALQTIGVHKIHATVIVGVRGRQE